MQQEASQVLLTLEETTHELRREATSARSFVVQAQEESRRSLDKEERALEESLKISTGLQRRVAEKVLDDFFDWDFFPCVLLLILSL